MLRNKFNKYLQTQIDEKSKTRAMDYVPSAKQVEEGSLVYVEGKGLYVKYKGQMKNITPYDLFSLERYKKQPTLQFVPPENTYNIHISAMHQYYVQAPSQLEGSGVASGYWNYLTKDFVDIYEPILTPISFRKINGVKIAASVTVGGTPDRIVGVMNLVSNVPTGQPVVWNDCAMKHAICFAKDTIWNTQTPDWYFMYKMEIVRFVNDVETLIDTRKYKIKFNPSGGVIKGIRRLYDSGDPPQPVYNPIIMLELIINVTL